MIVVAVLETLYIIYHNISYGTVSQVCSVGRYYSSVNFIVVHNHIINHFKIFNQYEYAFR